MSQVPDKTASPYRDSGVDSGAAEEGLRRATKRFRAGWGAEVKLDFKYFANVIDIDGTGIAVCTDGVGSKALIAQMTGTYDTIGIDCIAMNVNDLICVGATPISFVDYLAVEHVTPDMLDEISIGLDRGARAAGVSVSGGETAQLPHIIKGYRPGGGFDLAGTAVGKVSLDKILIGQAIEDGDVVIGLASNGIHSNGMTLARKIFFDMKNCSIDDHVPELGRTLGEELLAPTHIYVKEILDVLGRGLSVKALIHLTGDGFLNLNRVEANVGYVIDNLPEPPAIFSLIRRYGNLEPAEMYRIFNMGIGFCLIVGPGDVGEIIEIIRSHGRRAAPIGFATSSDPRTIDIPQLRLKGRGSRFVRY